MPSSASTSRERFYLQCSTVGLVRTCFVHISKINGSVYIRRYRVVDRHSLSRIINFISANYSHSPRSCNSYAVEKRSMKKFLFTVEGNYRNDFLRKKEDLSRFLPSRMLFVPPVCSRESNPTNPSRDPCRVRDPSANTLSSPWPPFVPFSLCQSVSVFLSFRSLHFPVGPFSPPKSPWSTAGWNCSISSCLPLLFFHRFATFSRILWPLANRISSRVWIPNFLHRHQHFSPLFTVFLSKNYNLSIDCFINIVKG